MQRAKNAERRKDTRAKIVLGALVIKAGAGDLPEHELMQVLTDYMKRREGIGPEKDAVLPETKSDR